LETGARTLRIKYVRLIIIAVGIAILVSALGPWWFPKSAGADEGINLEKAVLVSQGYHLYSEIWSDQPPFLTWVLVAVHKFFPFSIAAARTVILAFAILLAVTFFRIVSRFEGNLAAWTGVILLATSELYLKLSVSVLIGLPAVAMAMLSFDLATSGSGRSRKAFAIASGVVFSAAIMTKMFVLVSLPALLLSFRYAADGAGGRNRLPTLIAICLLSMLAAFGVILWFAGTLSFDQLVSPHVSARGGEFYSDNGGVDELLQELNSGAPLPFYGALLFGIPAMFAKPTGTRLIPAVWFMAGAVVLAGHAPLWWHQVLLLLPPLCWLAAAGIGAMVNLEKPPPLVEKLMYNSGKVIPILVWCLIAFVMIRSAILAYEGIGDVRKALNAPPRPEEQIAKLRLQLFNNGEGLVVSDLALDAYKVGRAVPPALAVWSEKRLVTGNITEQDIVGEIETNPVDQVLLRRFEYSDEMLERVGDYINRIDIVADRYSDIGIRHFARAHPANPAEASLLAQFRSVAGQTLGGVDKPEIGKRFARPQSEVPLSAPAIVARPPGSAEELGICALRISEQINSRRLLLEAVSIARALDCSQTQSGGWRSELTADPTCEGEWISDEGATFDDSTVPSILYFAFALSDRLQQLSFDPQYWLDEMIKDALSFSIKFQLPDGSWPLTVGDDGYHALGTLNDDVTPGMIRLLLQAYERNGDPALLPAAKKGGDFLLMAQGTGTQRAFAQQYNSNGVREVAAGARTFEPVAYASLETAYAINALVDLFLVTRDERYRNSAIAAADWLLSSQVSPEQWARFYEIGTNKPIYSTRSGDLVATIEQLPENERTTYRWIGGRDVFPELGLALDRVSAIRQNDLEAVKRIDQAFLQKALLANTPTARTVLDPAKAQVGTESLGGSTRAFTEYCAGLIAENTLVSDPGAGK
jgi:Pectic acid lyase/Dolichyl-phosphate-mannose-protein mannosyltransferase